MRGNESGWKVIANDNIVREINDSLIARLAGLLGFLFFLLRHEFRLGTRGSFVKVFEQFSGEREQLGKLCKNDSNCLGLKVRRSFRYAVVVGEFEIGEQRFEIDSVHCFVGFGSKDSLKASSSA